MPELVNQTTAKPTRKLQYAALGGGIASVMMGLVSMFFPEVYERVSPGFEGGVATIAAFMLGYLMKERSQ